MLDAVLIASVIFAFVVLLSCAGFHFIAPKPARTVYLYIRNPFMTLTSIGAGLLLYHFLANLYPGIHQWKDAYKGAGSACFIMVFYCFIGRYLLRFVDKVMDRSVSPSANEYP